MAFKSCKDRLRAVEERCTELTNENAKLMRMKDCLADNNDLKRKLSDALSCYNASCLSIN